MSYQSRFSKELESNAKTEKIYLKYLKYILSSRYNLHICRLEQATNYVHGMITNENCETWSLTNRSEIRFSVSLSTKIVMVRELCAPRDPATYDIDTEKFWCQFCSHYLHRIYEEEDWSDHYSEYRRLDEYLNSFLNITQVDYVKPKLAPELRNQVLKILYTSRSFDEAADRLSQVPMCV